MASDFFETSNYFVDKRNNFHEYSPIYNSTRERIGLIKQKLTMPQKIFRSIFGKKSLPFFVEIRSANGGLEASISRQSLAFFSDIIIQNGANKNVAILHKTKFKPEFKVLDTSNEVIAEIRYADKKNNLVVYDSSEKQIGSIEDLNAFMKTFLKSNSSYNVNVETNYSNIDEKIAILSSALFIKMFFFR